MLLVTAPAGYKTTENTAAQAPPPDRLGGLLGVEVVEHDIMSLGRSNKLVMASGESFPAGPFCSIMELRGATAIATYGGQFYAGSPAITAKAAGSGMALFVGALCSRECYRMLLERFLKGVGVRLHEWSSKTVEVVPLKAPQGEPPLSFVLNHSEQPANLVLPQASSCTDLLTGRQYRGTVVLPAHDVLLLKM